jgi:hypothetical protein
VAGGTATVWPTVTSVFTVFAAACR